MNRRASIAFSAEVIIGSDDHVILSGESAEQSEADS
jgi:hypothetical protein